MNIRRNRKGIQGFTLAELLIVVAIIAVLVAVSVPVFMNKMERTRKTVCEANRKILLRQILFDQMGENVYSQSGAEEILKNSDAYCPAGGTYSVECNELYVKVSCDIHGATNGGRDDGDFTVTASFLDDYIEFTVQYLKDHPTQNNDQIRAAFLEKYNGKWPALTVGKDVYSIQPFYQGADKTKPVEDCVWLFARTDGSASAGWSVPFVYVEGKWYGATNWNGELGGAANIRYNSMDDLKNAIKNNKHSNGNQQWIEITDFTESN